MPDQPEATYTFADLVLSWQIGRFHIPAGAAEWLDDLRAFGRLPAPAVPYEDRVAARARRTDGRPDYPGGPCDWATGEPLNHREENP